MFPMKLFSGECNAPIKDSRHFHVFFSQSIAIKQLLSDSPSDDALPLRLAGVLCNRLAGTVASLWTILRQ